MVNRKTLVILAVLAAAALAAAIAIGFARRPAGEDADARAYLLPALRGHVNDVSRVAVTGAGDKPVAVLERGGDSWTLAGKGGYPADTGKLRRFLLQLADARVLERKTALPARHADLGVEDVAGAEAGGLRVELEGLAQPVRLVIGKASPRGGGTYVRREGEDQVWLVSGDLKPGAGLDMDAGAEGNAWLDRDLIDIAADKVAEVRLRRGDDEVRLVKQAAADEHFVLDAPPKGREPADAWTLDAPAGWLAALRFDDVLPATEAAPAPGAVPLKARFVGFDGMVVEVEAWKAASPAASDAGPPGVGVDGEARHYARFSVTKVAARAGAGMSGLAVSDPSSGAAGQAANPADVDARIAALSTRLDGWTYVLPAHKYSALDKGREDFLRPR